MKPIAVFRFFPSEGPAYFGTFLDEHRLPWQLFSIDGGEPLPTTVDGFSGLCLMGGPMSANDPLPWIAPLLDLVRAAVVQDLPVIGHCLGAQLMARALGGRVSMNPVKEIGWHAIRLTGDACSKDWLGERATLPVFHWHGETFSIPPGATRIASSAWCENQMFALGKHLALQCHIEMTDELVRSWCAHGEREIARSTSPAVQATALILDDLDRRISALNDLAAGVYRRWLAGISASPAPHDLVSRENW